LARHKLIELHSQARLIVQRSEASAPFEPHCHIRIDLIADGNRGADVSVVVAFEFLKLRFGNVDLELPHDEIGKQLVRDFAPSSRARSNNDEPKD